MSNQETLNLVDALTKHDGFYAAFYCTYGADLAFFEEVLLHALRNKNVRHHVIFMDAARYADTVRHLRGSVSWVGRRYLIVPVHMPPFTSFHPKLALLAGRERGRLLVGSGNLTFTGYGQNRELYTCLDWDRSDTLLQTLFYALWQFLRQLHEQWTETALVGEIIRKTEYVAPWLTTADHEAHAAQHVSLRFLHTLQRPIFEQLSRELAAEAVKRITVVTPFLDRKLVALRRLFQQFHPDLVRLVLQENQAVGDPEFLERLMSSDAPLEIYRFAGEGRYLHAKLLIFETGMHAFALTGSANCTYAGLVGQTSEGTGNVEIALLRRGDSPDHFHYLLPDIFRPENRTSPEQLGLRLERLPLSEPGAADEGQHGGHIRLTEAAIAGREFSLRFQIQKTLPEAVTAFDMRFSTVPQQLIRMPIPSGEPAIISTDLSDSLLEILRRETALSVTAQGLDKKNRSIELDCNELWVTYADELREAARSGHHGAVRATDFLAGMLASSDSDWHDLYAEIQRLVELDVVQISSQPSTTTRKASTAARDGVPAERETPITIADADGILDLEEQEALVADIARESEFHAFFDYIRRGLPGDRESTTGNGEPSGTRKGDAGRRRQKWMPERRMRVRFLNLVKKYVRSLYNLEYMQQVRIPDALAYYVVFQRIVWLLYTHNESANEDEYLQLSLAINDGFFGSKLQRAPVLQPRLSRHLRYIWADDWLASEAALYSLVTLRKLRQLARHRNSDELIERISTCTVRVIACLHAATEVAELREQIEALLPLEPVAQAFDEQTEELALGSLGLLDTYRRDAIATLERWRHAAVFDSQEINDDERVRLLYQANVDYRRALYYLFEVSEQSDAQVAVTRELIFWSRRAGARIEANAWHERLIDFYFRTGQLRQMARELCNLGRQQCVAQDYAEAQRCLERAHAIAEELGDDQLISNCGHLAANISFFNQQQR